MVSYNFRMPRKIVSDDKKHSDEEPVKQHSIEKNETAGAINTGQDEDEESDVTEKIQRLNLYFEKENVRIILFGIAIIHEERSLFETYLRLYNLFVANRFGRYEVASGVFTCST